MNALSGAMIFVVQTLVSLYLVIVLLRFVLQLVKADFYNPLSQFAVRATRPTRPSPSFIRVLWMASRFSPSVAQSSSVSSSRKR